MNARILFTKYFLPLSLLFLIALSGCQGMPAFAFSPEAAAQQAVLNHPMPEFTVDPNSVQVLQMSDLGGGDRVVLVAFQGNRQNFGRESCLFSYNVYRATTGGWHSGGGGGGCGPQRQDPALEPISISSGKSSGGPTGIGYSEVSGEMFDPNIAMVQVTWSDGAQQQASVINRSYLAVRAGEFDYSKIEALDAEQKVIFSSELGIAPGKQ